MKVQAKRAIRLFFTGFSMGTADLIPGVSGGTIAFISGIYEELIYSIKLVTGDVLKLFLQLRFIEAIKLIPFKFLIPVGVGLLSAVAILSNLLSFLLSEYPVFIWSFFFGLVAASIYVVLKRVVKWDLSDKIAFITSAIAAYIIVGAVPVETPSNLLFFFLAGAIAIVAMILPGISGSFILLLLGKYQQVLEAVTSRDFLSLIVFLMGAALGLSVFSRVLTWLFAKHHDISIAILAGFMLGSLRKLWPWKEVVLTRVNSHGEVVPVVENNVLPQSLDFSVVAAVVLAVVAGFLVWQLDRMNLTREHTKDIENKKFEQKYKASLKNQ